MNCQRLIFLVVVTLAIVCRAETNSFGIYLTAEPVEPRVLHGEGNWSRVRLSKTPVISGSDIISYNFAEHSMRLRAEALARIPQPSVHGTPFVVVVNEERIYLGAFTTILSSIGPLAVPRISVDQRVFVTNQPADMLVIGRGAGPDLRGDPRIKNVLAALQKLNEADSWSAPANGLQARITLVEEPKEFGTRWIVPYLELRNVRDLAHPLEVRCDRQHV